MLFGVAPSAKNSDFTARLRHLPPLFIYFFCAIYFQGGVSIVGCNGINRDQDNGIDGN